MSRWFNWICVGFLFVSAMTAILSGIPVKEALITYGEMTLSLWVSGWVTWFVVKWLTAKFPLKFEWWVVRMIACLIIGMTIFSMVCQVLRWLGMGF